MADSSAPNDLIDTTEAARMCLQTPAGMRDWRVLGKGPRWAKVGRRVVYRRRDVEAYIDECFDLDGGRRR